MCTDRHSSTSIPFLKVDIFIDALLRANAALCSKVCAYNQHKILQCGITELDFMYWIAWYTVIWFTTFCVLSILFWRMKKSQTVFAFSLSPPFIFVLPNRFLSISHSCWCFCILFLKIFSIFKHTAFIDWLNVTWA